jgi:hypothetical protein
MFRGGKYLLKKTGTRVTTLSVELLGIKSVSKKLKQSYLTALLMGVKGLIWTTSRTKNNEKLKSHIK